MLLDEVLRGSKLVLHNYSFSRVSL
jgi:hypothetical protein